MKKSAIFILILFTNIELFSQNNENKDFIITFQKDTFYCDEVKVLLEKRICNFENGEKKTFKKNEVFSYSDDNHEWIYENRPYKPEKTNTKKTFMELLIQSQEYKFLTWRRVSQGKSIYEHYIFEKDKFVTYVDKKNYQELLKKYFGECEFIQNEIQNVKFKNLYLFIKKRKANCM